MSVYIMAQGQGSRWEKSSRSDFVPPAEFKQLVPLGKETIITRTIRQVYDRYLEPIVIAPGDFFPFMPEGIEFHSFREPTGTLLKGIWLTNAFGWFGDKTVFLLGDVVYSNKSMDEILLSECNSPFVYGRLGGNLITKKNAQELFALIVPNTWYRNTEERLFRVGGKLWDFYRSHDIELRPCFDFTDDVDSSEEYQEFYEILSGCALEDDKGLT